MRHNLPMPNEQPIQRWRCPAVLRVESAVFAAVGAAVALVFFPRWFAIPVAAVLAVVYGGMAVVGASVAVDSGGGALVFRMGLITRRVRLTDITAVLVDQAKVSIARSNSVEISLYVWGNSRLDRWLRDPAEATDIGHAIAGAVALAQDGQAPAGEAGTAGRPPARTRTSARTRSALSAGLLAGAGVVAIVAALLVRVHWHNPAMTVVAVILAFVLGLSGLLYLLVALLILLFGRSARRRADKTSTA
jgi:uncharacterized membrane protein YdbT with pleckstrin-like domain